ncbi:MAG: hypothetical protein NXI20_19905 [bacterium]|nr:hypothetical protein [bacterium]
MHGTRDNHPNGTGRTVRIKGNSGTLSKAINRWVNNYPSPPVQQVDLNSLINSALSRSQYLRQLSVISKKWMVLHEELDVSDTFSGQEKTVSECQTELMKEILGDLNRLSKDYSIPESKQHIEMLNKISKALNLV